ncbi:MAG: HAMP domain-containing histidine kinase [Chloroflexi bacterium]|nr:HAMP domain-containing histidine kinase [Chloroflexota bacterium]
MFRRIRWRLVAWTMAVLVLILGVLGMAVYAALSNSLMDQVDRSLMTQSDLGHDALKDLARGRPSSREGYRGGTFYVLVGPDGQILGNPQRVTVDVAALPRPADRRPTLASATLNGEPARLLTRPVSDEDVPDGSVLIVGQSLAQERAALSTLLLILVAGGGAGLALSFAGAWFLAGRALVPIEQAFRRQQEFVADASHELRTPLTVLRSATDLLAQHRDEPLAANGELFEDIRLEIARLERLTGDLLTLARSDRDDLVLAVAPFDAATVAADLVRRLRPLAAERGVTLDPHTYDPPPIVEADPDRFQQILLILLDNAIRHSPIGGRVDVTIRQQGGDVLVEVADTGSGIAPEQLPRVFDRFYRADPSRTRAAGGTGLGLAIAKTLVEAHGGTLSLTSTVGVGTRATVRLPAGPPAPDIPGEPGRVEPPRPSSAAGRHAR